MKIQITENDIRKMVNKAIRLIKEGEGAMIAPIIRVFDEGCLNRRNLYKACEYAVEEMYRVDGDDDALYIKLYEPEDEKEKGLMIDMVRKYIQNRGYEMQVIEDPDEMVSTFGHHKFLMREWSFGMGDYDRDWHGSEPEGPEREDTYEDIFVKGVKETLQEFAQRLNLGQEVVEQLYRLIEESGFAKNNHFYMEIEVSGTRTGEYYGNGEGDTWLEDKEYGDVYNKNGKSLTALVNRVKQTGDQNIIALFDRFYDALDVLKDEAKHDPWDFVEYGVKMCDVDFDDTVWAED